MKMLLILIFGLSVSAQAKIRVVDRGGGFAEMQAYALDKRLPTYAKLCQAAGNPCQLSSQEKSWVDLLVKNETKIVDELIQLNTTCAAPFVHLTDRGYSVDSCALYLEEVNEFGPQPKSLVEIGQVLLLARISALEGAVMSWPAAQSLAKALLIDLNYSEALYVVDDGKMRHRLNIWSMQAGSEKVTYVSLESPKSSTDLTESFLESLSCKEGPVTQWQLDGIQVNKNRVLASARWRCGSREFSAKVGMTFVFQNETLSKAEFLIFGKESL